MQTLRLLLASILVLAQCYLPASGETARTDPPRQISGDGRLISPAEATYLLKRYNSIPGNGVVKGDARIITPAEASDILKHYGSVPGGLILEGAAGGLDWVSDVRYDSEHGTFVLNGRVVYVSPIQAQGAAALASAIAADDRIGVSLGEETEIVYGSLPTNSELALDLKLADLFLADIVLPPQEWTIGYRYAGGFEPRKNDDADVPAVFFRIEDVQFDVKDEKLVLTSASFRARIVPVSETSALDGGYLPDMEAIQDGRVPHEYETNAKHVAENIDYYLREEIVARIVAYGEEAAFFRGLKKAGIDLSKLARELETPLSPSKAMTLEEGWRVYLMDIQARNSYENWSSPPFDAYMGRNNNASCSPCSTSVTQATSK